MKQIGVRIAVGALISVMAVFSWQVVMLRQNLLEKMETVNLMISKYEAKAQFVDEYLPTVKEYAESEITAKRILAAVYENSIQYDIQPELILSVILVESEFNPDASSNAGAIGLMQIMPVTGVYVGRSLGYSIKSERELYDIEKNIKIGVVFLKECIERLGEQRGLGYYYAGRYTQHYNRYTAKIDAAKELWAPDVASLTYNLQ
ncbi:MAG: transglycosylase SLT domain-containing protein [candidate division WOR-3 bacterium]|nr:MAG: transglycosylase SLT domain-containing protein [candidate division WOR-3 bacterium]